MSKDHLIIIERTFKFPRKTRWHACTDAEAISAWYGPKGFRTRVEDHDFREGGAYRYVMIGPDGKEYPSVGRFVEIVEFSKIVATDDFGEGFEYDKPLPDQMVSTQHFEDHADGSKLIISISHPTEADRQKHIDMGVVDGWQSSLDCLDEYVAGKDT